MALTYESIATTTFSSVTDFTFTSIPSTYTDLVIIFNGVGSSVTNLTMQFNGDTNTNYSATYVLGDGSSVATSREGNTTSGTLTAVYTSGRSQVNVSIQNYTNVTTYKSYLARFSDATAQTSGMVGLWRSTSAISSIKILKLSSGTMSGFATIYGIKAA